MASLPLASSKDQCVRVDSWMVYPSMLGPQLRTSKMSSRLFFVLSVVLLCSIGTSLRSYSTEVKNSENPTDGRLLTYRDESSAAALSSSQLDSIRSSLAGDGNVRRFDLYGHDNNTLMPINAITTLPTIDAQRFLFTSFDPNWSSHQKCSWAKEFVLDRGPHIPYLEICFCWFDSKFVLSLLPLSLIYWFWLSALISDLYLSPPLVHLASLLNLSEALAGCTVVAMANAAPDLLCGAIAAHSDVGQLSIFMGGLFGSSLVLTSFVYGAVVFSSRSPTLIISKTTQCRDTFFLLFNLCCLFCIPFVPSTCWWGPFLFLLSFAAYVAVAVYLDRRCSRFLTITKSEKEKIYNDETSTLIVHGEQQQDWQYDTWSDPSHDGSAQRTINIRLLEDNGFERSRSSPNFVSARSSFSHVALETKAGKRLLSRILTEPTDKQGRYLEMLSSRPAESLASLTAEFQSEDRSSNVFTSFLHVVSRILTGPVLLLWKMSIPTVDGAPTPRWRSACLFVTIPLVIAFHFWRRIEKSTFLIVLVVGMLTGVIYFVTDYFLNSKARIKLHHGLDGDDRIRPGFIRTCLAGFMAVFWSGIITGEVIECIVAVGQVFGISNEILGLTVMAWANNLGDFFANTAIAKAGHPEMGLAGAYGASIVTISFGIPLIGAVQTGKLLFEGMPLRLVPVSFDGSLLLTGAALISVIVSWFAYGTFNRFKVSRNSGIFLIAVFILTNIGVVLCNIFHEWLSIQFGSVF